MPASDNERIGILTYELPLLVGEACRMEYFCDDSSVSIIWPEVIKPLPIDEPTLDCRDTHAWRTLDKIDGMSVVCRGREEAIEIPCSLRKPTVSFLAIDLTQHGGRNQNDDWS